MIDSVYSYNAFNSISDTHFDTDTTEWSNPDSDLLTAPKWAQKQY